ncbi:hypothetical protein BCV70DRAFT_61380 [Testicularia cyperi]|uniref:Uncharacterized protein n=1 Tax=Testicularia cyperi TaxID=1882483 RepID=A0A317XYE9_9BASI|nr:hypothetical protein BCV70DRAFT_61380 [Testicularia cyperi]
MNHVQSGIVVRSASHMRECGARACSRGSEWRDRDTVHPCNSIIHRRKKRGRKRTGWLATSFVTGFLIVCPPSQLPCLAVQGLSTRPTLMTPSSL